MMEGHRRGRHKGTAFWKEPQAQFGVPSGGGRAHRGPGTPTGPVWTEQPELHRCCLWAHGLTCLHTSVATCRVASQGLCAGCFPGLCAPGAVWTSCCSFLLWDQEGPEVLLAPVSQVC